ncbi:hypothetical protein AWJ20_4972 [Sugiyamaella lignohabitans]|uniref:Uncharacterized protein n=1 Tax=Sugiyamaella lignohabitans TaxID=796027 RepID=A0A161HL91_9ASCO|nr:uncharacterized protein AWJ20_4972 [Sugiyamaella lignohabitans]ANB14017.1 hypothetical protein AWJ20_4972 [Sugiyamaella lignohabitans]
MELLDLDESSILDAICLTGLVQSSEDLTRTQNKTFRFLLGVNRNTVFSIFNNPLEVRVTSEVLNGGTGQRMTQQRLRECQDKRLSESSVHLSSQQVEQVGRSRGVGNLHVTVLVLTFKLVRRWENSRVFIGKLEVTFNSCRRVLRSLTVVTVRKRQNKTSSLGPLGLTGSHKLISNDLGGVGEITELGLPNNKSIGTGQ